MNRLIFVSCGQLTAEERAVGKLICEVVNSTDGFEAYFAEEVQNLAALGEHILDALRRASGAIVVLHPRGTVTASDGTDLGIRSSVWINQEVAILAYRRHFERCELPILAFKHPSIRLEGAMTAFILNPKDLAGDEGVRTDVRSWLAGSATTGSQAEQTVFEQKWRGTTDDDRALLRALIEEGGHGVKDASIRRRLREYPQVRERASEVLRLRRLKLSAANLIRLTHNIYDGDEMSLHEVWEWHVRHAVASDDGA